MAAFIPQDLRIYRFHPDGLDPIAVYVEQFGPTASRITVQCYAQAWTAYWGSHGEAGVEAFIASCSADYIADNLLWGRSESTMLKQFRKSHRDYVVRIAAAIRSEFAERAKPVFKPGMKAVFKGETYKIVALGDVPGTFDLHPESFANGADSWRNVPPSKLSLAQEIKS